MKLKFSLFVLFSLLLTGCVSSTYRQSNANINQTQNQINNAKLVTETSAPPVLTKSGFYVDANPVALDNNPAWLKRIVSVQANRLPFNLLMTRLLRNCPVVVSYDRTINANRSVSLNYTGSILGALETLAAETDYSFIPQDHDIRWSAFETRTFNIAFMPGSSNYLVGQQQNSSGSSNNNTSTTGAGSPVNQINDQQYSNLEGQLSVWQDLERTLNQLKSTQGHVVVSESTTSVTIHDRPSNVHAVEQYITQLNNNLDQEVAIKVQILEVELNKDFNYGVDWNVVANTLGTRFNLTGNMASATNLTQNTLLLQSATSAASGLRIGNLNGAQTLINVLSQQGKVRVVTEPEVVTMNNQIASIRITQNVGYVQSVSQSLSQNFLTTSVTPGSVTDGFTLYILPKIQDEKVYMQITSTIANLERLEKVSTAPDNSSNTQNNSASNNSGQQQFEAIQVPTISQKAFNQRSTVSTGSTLIIAGYKRLRDAVTQSNFFGAPPPLGGAGAQTNNIETLVLITPIILHSSQSNVHINTK